MTDGDLADIERGAMFAGPGYDEAIEAIETLVAEVRRLREQLAEREACTHGVVTECRECGFAAFSWENDRLRARVAQLEGRDTLDVFRPGGA